jgi:signal peptidase I
MNETPTTLCKPIEPQKPLKACFEVAEVLASAVLAIAILFTFVLRFAGVVGASMEPTLQHQDWLAITAYANPRAGQVVIISPRDNTFNEPRLPWQASGLNCVVGMFMSMAPRFMSPI